MISRCMARWIIPSHMLFYNQPLTSRNHVVLLWKQKSMIESVQAFFLRRLRFRCSFEKDQTSLSEGILNLLFFNFLLIHRGTPKCTRPDANTTSLFEKKNYNIKKQNNVRSKCNMWYILLFILCYLLFHYYKTKVLLNWIWRHVTTVCGRGYRCHWTRDKPSCLPR